MNKDFGHKEDDKDAKRLKDFFSICFNQDWRVESGTPEVAIAEYARGLSREELSSLASLIFDYAQRFATNVELEDNLFSELLCYYRPSRFGESAKIWVENIAHQLTNIANGIR